MLSEEKFQSLYGNGWVLADGRCVSLDCCKTPLDGVDLEEWKTRKKCSKLLEKNSAYFKETGTGKIPDARGKFLRAKNNGITSEDCSGENTDCFDSDGDRDLGSYQKDELKIHNHNVSIVHHHDIPMYGIGGGSGTGIAYTGGGNYQGTRSSHSVGSPATPTTNKGIQESRPKNIAVNVFIKIN